MSRRRDTRGTERKQSNTQTDSLKFMPKRRRDVLQHNKDLKNDELATAHLIRSLRNEPDIHPDSIIHTVDTLLQNGVDGDMIMEILCPVQAIPQEHVIKREAVLDFNHLREIAFAPVGLAIQNGLPVIDEMVDVDGQLIGLPHLAYVTNLWDCAAYCKGEKTEILEDILIVLEAKRGFFPKDKKIVAGGITEEYSYRWSNLDGDFFDLFGPVGFDVSGVSTAWVTASGEYAEMSNVVPVLTVEQLINFGIPAYTNLIESLQSTFNHTILATTAVTAFDNSVSAFAITSPKLYDSPHLNRYRVIRHDVPIPPTEWWLAACGLAVFDPAGVHESIKVRGNAYVGGTHMNFKLGRHLEGRHNFEVYPSMISGELAGLACLASMIRADIEITEMKFDRTGVHNIDQQDDSVFLAIGNTELALYILNAIYWNFSFNNFVGMFYSDDLTIPAGMRFVPNARYADALLPAFLVERLETFGISTLKVQARQRYYVPVLCYGENYNSLPDGTVTDDMSQVLALMWPDVSLAQIDYDFDTAKSSALIPLSDVSKSITRGNVSNTAWQYLVEFFSELSVSVYMDTLNGFNTDRNFGGITRCVFGEIMAGFTVADFEVFAVVSDVPFHPFSYAWETGGLLPMAILGDLSATLTERKILLDVFREGVGQTNAVFFEEVLAFENVPLHSLDVMLAWSAHYYRGKFNGPGIGYDIGLEFVLLRGKGGNFWLWMKRKAGQLLKVIAPISRSFVDGIKPGWGIAVESALSAVGNALDVPPLEVASPVTHLHHVIPITHHVMVRPTRRRMAATRVDKVIDEDVIAAVVEYMMS